MKSIDGVYASQKKQQNHDTNMESLTHEQSATKKAMHSVMLCLTCVGIVILLVWLLHLFGYLKN